jgi:hypothetical protein
VSAAWPLHRLVAAHRRLPAVLAWFSLAFWLYYAFLRQVAGPLNHDEIYFSHILWLLNQGKRQYIDFYSNHLPAYFQLLEPLVAAISRGPADLSYLWGVRLLSVPVIAAYLALAWLLRRAALPHAGRAGLLALGALLLMFVVLARMVEVRPDTFGLLLVNAAWAAVLCARTTRSMVAAAVLAGLAILFSARAGGMVAVLGLLLLYLSARSHDWAAVRALLGVAGGFLAAALVLYLAAPEWVALVVRSCFLEPAKLLKGLPLWERFLAPERIPLTVLIAGGLIAGMRLGRQGDKERGLVVAVASAAQLLLVVLDPSPYQYVYGWAAVPVVLGLVSASPVFSLYFPSALAAVIVSVSVGYGILHGEAPATSSYFRLTFDAPLDEHEFARLPTPVLVSQLISDKRQMNLTNQLRVRSEVCRRLQGSVLTTFDTHPICLDDAMFYWTGLRWPPLMEGDPATPDAMPPQAFAQIFVDARPSVFIWGRRRGPPRTLLPATQQMLACCYELHEGFALSRESGRGSAGTR